MNFFSIHFLSRGIKQVLVIIQSCLAGHIISLLHHLIITMSPLNTWDKWGQPTLRICPKTCDPYETKLDKQQRNQNSLEIKEMSPQHSETRNYKHRSLHMTRQTVRMVDCYCHLHTPIIVGGCSGSHGSLLF